jgi:histidinol-phosphate aminotransferase
MSSSPFWSPIVHQLAPYVPGEQPKGGGPLVKLNTNEHPNPPSPRVLAAIQAVLADEGAALRLYPDPGSSALREALARHHGVTPEQVFIGNGSDEVLAHAFQALLNHVDAAGAPKPLLMPDITYSFYATYCRLYQVTPALLPLADDFSIDLAAYAARHDAGAVILPNPNAPTGRALPREAIAALLAARPDVPVLIDEAYVDFGAESVVPLVNSHPNLLVVHTMSKSRSLAGLRIGYAIGQAPLIEALTRVKDSFNSYPLDRVAQAAALASVEDDAHFRAACAEVIAQREVLVGQLAALGFETVPSKANFVFTRHPAQSGDALLAALRARGVLVRRFAAPARIADHLRITIGTPAQNAALIDALKNILGDTTHAAQ